MRRSLIRLVLCLGVVFVGGSSASADPGGPFRRTTPRGFFDRDGGGLVIGIPGGRAWGIESALVPLPSADQLTVELAVDDPDVAEAFVRIAYYAVADRRSRQLVTVDSPFVRLGPERRVTIDLEPPPGAVAYRVRVLGRLVAGALVSRANAIRARWEIGGAAEQGSRRASLTRLLTDVP